MKLQKRTTSKLFYRKWAYKIVCLCPGSHMIKRSGPGVTMLFCLSSKIDTWNKHVDKENLAAFLSSVEPFLSRKDLQIRTERSTFSVFCSDPLLFKQLCNAIGYWASEVWEPASDEERDLMVDSNSKKVLCNELPHGTYTYKVFLRSNIAPSTRESFFRWHENYPNKILIPKSVGRWLKGEAYWSSSSYVYVANTSTLSMVGLFLGSGVLRTEEFVLRSSINTLTEEEPCQV